MIATGIKFTPESMAGFRRLIDETTGTLAKDRPRAIKFVTATFGRSCIAATPNGRFKRHVVPAPSGTAVEWQRTRRSSRQPDTARYAVEVLNQTGRPTYLGYATRATAMASKARPIIRRGLADLVWKIAIAKAKASGADGASIGTPVRSASAGAIALRSSDGSFRDVGDVSECQLANQLPYIIAIDQGGPHNPPAGIFAHAIPASMKRMKWLLSEQARRMAARWGNP